MYIRKFGNLSLPRVGGGGGRGNSTEFIWQEKMEVEKAQRGKLERTRNLKGKGEIMP
jgi:hypothetical protein